MGLRTPTFDPYDDPLYAELVRMYQQATLLPWPRRWLVQRRLRQAMQVVTEEGSGRAFRNTTEKAPGDPIAPDPK